MRAFKWLFWGSVWLVVGAFLHYTLPQNDTVRVVNTEIQRMDFGENSIFWAEPDSGSDVTATNRDVRFIQTVRPNGRASVYRNEDTGAGWPPYFKFDSSNLQAEAANAVSTAADPQWVVLKHYGWRNEFLTIFPNAVSIKPAPGPDYRQIPYVAIAVWVIFLAVTWAIFVRWRRFKAARITPVVDDLDAAWDMRVERFRRWREARRAERKREKIE